MYIYTVSMSIFKATPHHRRRRHRRRGSGAKVLNEAELSELLGKNRTDLTQELERLDWPYHRDAGNQIWASVPQGYEGSGRERQGD